MDEYEGIVINTGETIIFLRRLGNGPPLLLLHGFPETHLMWRDIAPLLADHFTVICADLRGYGQSGCPKSDTRHFPYSKRAMAKEMAIVMERLGFTDFYIAGHDRGARVAYRLALDFSNQVKKLCVLDIIPGLEAWNRADKQFALEFWPWSLMAQTAPFPEELIAATPESVINNVITDWGTPETVFPPDIKEAYTIQLGDPKHIHAICEEYRAASTIDTEHDTEDLKNGRKIQCPVHVLWAADGPLDTLYKNEGGPLEIWRKWAKEVSGNSIKGGHFFPEESPALIAHSFISFFR
jgi:haloacetate dehalogenase